MFKIIKFLRLLKARFTAWADDEHGDDEVSRQYWAHKRRYDGPNRWLVVFFIFSLGFIASRAHAETVYSGFGHSYQVNGNTSDTPSIPLVQLDGNWCNYQSGLGCGGQTPSFTSSTPGAAFVSSIDMGVNGGGPGDGRFYVGSGAQSSTYSKLTYFMFKMTGFPAGHSAVHLAEDVTGNHEFDYYNSSAECGAAGFDYYDGSVNHCVATGNYMDSQWHQAAIVQNGSHLDFWIDGTHTAVLTTTWGGLNCFGQCGYSGGTGYGFYGAVDDVVTGDTPLSSSTITALWNSGTPDLLVTVPSGGGGGGAGTGLNMIWPGNATSSGAVFGVPPFTQMIFQAASATSSNLYSLHYCVSQRVLDGFSIAINQLGCWGTNATSGVSWVAGQYVPWNLVQPYTAGDYFDIHAVLYDTTSGVAVSVASTTRYVEILGTSPNAEAPTISSPGTSSTTPTIATSSAIYTPGLIPGTVPASNVEVFGAGLTCNDPGDYSVGQNGLYLLCLVRNFWVIPSTSTKNFAAGGFQNLEGSPPFVYVFGVFNAVSLQGQALQTVTSSDLLFQFHHIGVGNIVPTSSFAIISNTAFADMSGDPDYDAQIHSQLFNTEDQIMVLIVVGIIFYYVKKARTQYH